jgi:acyl-CoA synthetase (AMP-forming)/AMP-acid ligase II
MSTKTASDVLLTLENRAGSETLLDRARLHYTQRPDATALIFIPAGGEATRHISYREFFDGAGCYAEALRHEGVAARDLVILVMEHSEALLYAFWGAMMMGAIPSIFPFLSDKLDPAMYYERVRLLISHSGARAVIASEQFAGPLREAVSGSKVPILSESELEPARTAPTFATDVRGEDVAFLQHSSGTTGLQKGVALSHAAVLNQVASYSRAIRLTEDDRIVSWLPLYHDMGLIAGFILPLVQGVPLALMSPFHWVRDPKSLVWAITEHRATLCWLPNFAYNFMAQRVRDKDIRGVDLSTMRAFINCSEPMRVESHRMFLERYAPYGLSAATLATCYAMAENTFAVTQGGIDAPATVDVISRAALANEHRAQPHQGNGLSMEMLSCGPTIPNCQVRIVDDARHDLPERHVGEVAVHSDSMLTGYHNRDDLTAQVMFDGWYLTGDFGYLAAGELYITGRKKDLIIVGGKNIYPQDLEVIASDVPGVIPGRTVAFGVDDERLGTESVVMVVESEIEGEDARWEIAKEVRRRVAQQTEVALSDVLVAEPKWLHKTSSGKIARGANHDKYLSQRLEEQRSAGSD